MPCYTPEPTKRELMSWHEEEALRICNKAIPHRIRVLTRKDGPKAVRLLCEWCGDHTAKEIAQVGATYWYKAHQKYDLQQSGLSKLTTAEIDALGLNE